MKIAFIVPSLINHGPVIVAYTIVKHLVDKVELIDVFYFDKKYGLTFPCSTCRIKANKPIPFDEYDIIHSHGYRPDKYLASWKQNIRRAKIVTTIHSDIKRDLNYSYNFFVSLIFTRCWVHILRRFDAVVAISEKLCKLYSKDFKLLYRIYNGVDIQYAPTDVNPHIAKSIYKFKTNGYRIIGTYAYLTKVKGVEQLLNILPLRADLAVVIIGEGKAKQELIALSKKLAVEQRVLFCDYLPAPYNYLSLFDVYAICSRSEGFGLALVEAALTHTPIVCSDIEVFHEIFNEDQVSYFKLDEKSSLLQAIEIALSFEGKQKCTKAFRHGLEQFSGKVMADNYLSLYRSLL